MGWVRGQDGRQNENFWEEAGGDKRQLGFRCIGSRHEAIAPMEALSRRMFHLLTLRLEHIRDGQNARKSHSKFGCKSVLFFCEDGALGVLFSAANCGGVADCFGFVWKRRFWLAKRIFGNGFVSYLHRLGNGWTSKWGIVLKKELLAGNFFKNRRRE